MSNDTVKAEIIVNGLVQGVGFRYFVYRHATSLGLTGYVQNLHSGEVLTIVEGSRPLVEELFSHIRTGPSHSSVKNARITWQAPDNEFTNFEIRH